MFYLNGTKIFLLDLSKKAGLLSCDNEIIFPFAIIGSKNCCRGRQFHLHPHSAAQEMGHCAAHRGIQGSERRLCVFSGKRVREKIVRNGGRTMKQAKRRVWSILLACVMLLTMLPAGAWAADGVKEVADSGALLAAFEQDGEVRLTADITLTTSLTVEHTNTLDLNGYHLILGAKRINVQPNSNLTISDGSADERDLSRPACMQLLFGRATATLPMRSMVIL